MAEQSELETLTGAIDALWVAFCAILVFIMQIGFTFFEAGHDRRKNLLTTLFKNLMDLCCTAVGYWCIGHYIQFREYSPTHGGTLIEMLYFYLFAAATATIVGGAVIGRIRLWSYLALAVVVGGVIEPFLAHWGE